MKIRQLATLIFVVFSGPTVAAKELTSLKSGPNLLAKFSIARRSEMIEIAKRVALDRYGKVEFEDFATVVVEKNFTEKKSGEYRISFQAAVSDSVFRPKKSNSFVVLISEGGASVTPPKKENLATFPREFRKIGALFGANQRITVKTLPDRYEVIVNHSGGAEAYGINKTTMEKKLLWHEEHAVKLESFHPGWIEIENEGPNMKDGAHLLGKFELANRAEMILMALGLAREVYRDFDLTDYSKVTALKKTGHFKVVFRAPYDLVNGRSKTTNTFAVHISAAGVIVDPRDVKYLRKFPPDYRKIAAKFAPDDSIGVTDHPDHFEVSVSHRKGGAEGYKINKKTFEKKMTWHEHPEPHDDGPAINLKTGKPVPDEWVEIEE